MLHGTYTKPNRQFGAYKGRGHGRKRKGDILHQLKLAVGRNKTNYPVRAERPELNTLVELAVIEPHGVVRGTLGLV